MAQALLALILGLALAAPVAAAQVKSDAKKPAGPAWSELKPAQQQVLAPLASEWEKLDATRRKKWVEIADRYLSIVVYNAMSIALRTDTSAHRVTLTPIATQVQNPA